MRDVVIAGAGPAGATLAILLGRAGLRVDLFDARRFPRDKPCGEGIMPAGVAVLRRLGLLDLAGGRALASVRYHGFGLTAESVFPSSGPGQPRPFVLAQRRLHLDQLLLATARATAGVRVFEQTAVEGVMFQHGRAVGLRVGGETRRGRLVVGADGVHSPVRRALGLDAPAPVRARERVGVRMHFRLAAGSPGAPSSSPSEPARLDIFLGHGHELYCAPLPDRELLVAALCPREALAGGASAAMAGFIAAHPMVAAWLKGAEPITAPAGRSPVSTRARAGFAAGAVLLGDAAHASDPLTAGGIAHALVTAERLAHAVPRILADGDAGLVEFDRERRDLLRAHDWLTRALVRVVGRPRLARATLRGMRAFPRVMRALMGVGGGVAIQPPRLASITSAAPSSASAVAIRRATATNDIPSQLLASR